MADSPEVPVNMLKSATARTKKTNARALRVLTFPRKQGARTQPYETEETGDKSDPVIRQLPVQKRGAPGRSKVVTEDPFIQLQKNGLVIEPPFDLLSLAVMPEHNSELTPIVEAMETNCESLGHLLKPRMEPVRQNPEIRKKIRAEFVRLTNFFAYANIKDSWVDFRRKLRRDLEVTGNAFFEIVRDASGEIQSVEHIPSYQMRLTPQEAEPVLIETPVLELQEDDSYRVVPIPRWERFRKFVQSRAVSLQGSFARTTFAGYLVRWFKEFGDPRVYHNETGLIVAPAKVEDWDGKGNPMPDVKRANEIAHLKLYSVRSPYGVPRYVGNLLSIVGDRASEEINFQTFKNNNIPSMAMLVSNGQLTGGTLDRIEDFVESEIQGSDNYSKILIIEAESPNEDGEDQGNVKIDIKPLQNAQPRDAFFQNYSKNNKANVRRAWRIPPIHVGQGEDYSRNVAETSRKLADEQVFAPERLRFDQFINRRLFPEMGVIYHEYQSNTPNTTDNKELVSILSDSEKTGGMTPRIARKVLESILSQHLPDFPEGTDFNPDLPFSLAMAEAVKNKADPAEPGQQVTALKSLEAFGIIGGQSAVKNLDAIDGEMVRTLVKLRNRLEQKWNEDVAESADDGSL